MKIMLPSIFMFLSYAVYAQDENKPTTTPTYQNAETLLTALKDPANEAVNGPFLLTIKSVTKHKYNTHLNTQENPSDANNIIIELPPFIMNHYQNNYKSDVKTLFLNQNLVIKGKAKVTEYVTEGEKPTTSKTPTIKIIMPEQLRHYD